MLVYDFQFGFDECKRTFYHAFNMEEFVVACEAPNVEGGVFWVPEANSLLPGLSSSSSSGGVSLEVRNNVFRQPEKVHFCHSHTNVRETTRGCWVLFFGRFLINIHKIPAKFSCLLIFRWGAMLEHPNLVPFAVLLPPGR